MSGTTGGEFIFFLCLTDYSLQISLTVLFLLLLLLESFADDHHFKFQTLKHSLTPEERNFHRNKEIRDGFYQSGTFFLLIFLFLNNFPVFQGFFKISRHPNYFAEQAMWVVVYLFSCVGRQNRWINWTIVGCLQLILLFQGSMNFGESLTSSK
jgi:steroid 5-alpha reductase family enzyme